MNGTYCLQLAWWLTCKCWYVERGVSFDLYVLCPWYLLILLLLLVLVSQEHQQAPVSQEHQPVPVSQEGQVVQLVPFRSSAYVVLKKKHADVKTSPPILFRSENAPPPFFFCFKENLKPWERGSVMPLTNNANLPNELHTGSWATF